MKILILAASVIASSACADQIPNSDFGYGNWSGAAYTINGSGEFSHCAISAPFNSGNTLFFSVNADATVSVAVGAPVDTFVPNETFPVALYVDRATPFYGDAFANDSKLAILKISDFDRALESFRRGRTLTIQSKYGSIPFDLTGTSRALSATFNCSSFYVRQKTTSASASPSTKEKLDPAILMQITTGQIASLGATDFQYLTSAEVIQQFPKIAPDIQAAFWKSPALNLVSGVFVIDKKASQTLKDYDAPDLTTLSSACADEFNSSLKQIPHDTMEVREIKASCVNSAGSVETYVDKFFLGDKVVYTWLMFQLPAGTGETGASRDQMNEKAAIFAANFVVKK